MKKKRSKPVCTGLGYELKELMYAYIDAINDYDVLPVFAYSNKMLKVRTKRAIITIQPLVNR